MLDIKIMEATNVLNIYNIFHLCCILATIGTASWCIYRYSLNEDLTVNSFNQFNQDRESIYPSISVCFPLPCLDGKIKDIHINSTCRDYIDMKSGLTLDEKLLSVNFDRFTIDLKEYFLNAILELQNESYKNYNPFQQITRSNLSIQPYSAIQGPNYKCHSFELPYIHKALFNIFEIHLNRSFPYPNQINLDYLQIEYFDQNLNFDKNKTSSHIVVEINSLTTLNRRKKSDNDCNSDWKRDDIIRLEDITKKLNCRHPHINISHNLPPCSGNDINRFSWDSIRRYPSPCNSIMESSINTYWSEMFSFDKNIIAIQIRFYTNGKFKKISQVIAKLSELICKFSRIFSILF